MKTCKYCGKELMDAAVICVGCGCPVEQEKSKPSVSLMSPRRKKTLIIIFSVLFVVFIAVAISFVCDIDFIKATDRYNYSISEFGRINSNWQQNAQAAKREMMEYLVPAGIFGTLALGALVGDIIMFTRKTTDD